MTHGCGLSDDQAYDLLAREFNPNCSPSWNLDDPKDVKDFRRKITESRKHPPAKPYRWILDDPAYAPIDAAKLKEAIDVQKLIANSMPKQADIGTALNNQQATGKSYRVWTAAKLMAADFSVQYLIDKILVALQPCIVAGQKKVLKTSLLVDLAISLTTAGQFLGVFKVPNAVRVGLMTGESGLGTIQETIERICKAASVNPHSLDKLFITDEIPRFEDPAHLRALADFIRKHSLNVLIIDPVYLAMSGADAGNLFKQGERLRGISELCNSHNVTLILCHHNKKNLNNKDQFSLPELDDIAWAGFGEFARQWILLGRRELYIPGTGEHRLWLTVGGSAGHSGAWGLDVFEGTRDDEGGRVWQSTLQPASEIIAVNKERRNQAKTMAERAARDDRCKRIWKYLNPLWPNGATKNQIRNELGIDSKRLPEMIETLLENGNIEPCKVEVSNGKQGKGRKCDGFRVFREPDNEAEKQKDLFESK